MTRNTFGALLRRRWRNEPLDLRNYATAALEIANPVLQMTDGVPQPRKRQAGRRMRGGI